MPRHERTTFVHVSSHPYIRWPYLLLTILLLNSLSLRFLSLTEPNRIKGGRGGGVFVSRESERKILNRLLVNPLY